MDKLKNFLSKKKIDKHFKHSGQGARLSDEPSSAPSVRSGSMQGGGQERVHTSDVAAAAALKRLYANEPTVSSSQKKIQMIAQRELEKERRERESIGAKFSEEIKNLAVQEPEVRELDHSNAINCVKFSCDLLGDDVVLPKEELRLRLESFLRSELEENPVVAASLMLSSLNKTDDRKIAAETIKKYLQNILENCDEPKFRKIRMANKAFKERVEAAKGGREFLEAIGFEYKMESVSGGESEPFLVMGEESATNMGKLLQAVELLDGAEPLALRVARDTKVFTLKEGECITAPKLPSDFFTVTGDELKKEQERMTVNVDRLTTMRTREMRDRDARVSDNRYKYSLVRVRTPDRCLVQGVFGVHESVSAVREWIQSLLSHPDTPFTLLDSTTPFKDESASLVQLGLVPAVVVHLGYKGEVSAGSILAGEHMTEALPFSIE